MHITPETLNFIFQNLDMRYNQGFTSYTPIWESIATEIPSTGRENIYPMSTLLPQMREWIGERQVQNGITYAYSVQNKDYEATLSLKRNDIEDDNLGLQGNVSEGLGLAARRWPDQVLFEMIMNGESTPGHDGQYFFDTDHPVSIGNPASPTVSNVFNVPDLNIDVLAALNTIGAAWKNEAGDSLNIKFDTLLIPTSLRFKAGLAVGPMFIHQGQAVPNPLANAFKIIEAPYLDKRPNEFYLLYTSGPIRPFIWQLRKAPEFVELTSPTDNNVFWRKDYIYGVDARGNAGFGLWFTAIKARIVPGAAIPAPPNP